MFELPLSHKILIDALIRALLLTVLSHLLITGYIVNIPILRTIIVVIFSLVPAFLVGYSLSQKIISGYWDLLCSHSP